MKWLGGWPCFDVLYLWHAFCPSFQDTGSPLTKTCSAELLKDNEGLNDPRWSAALKTQINTLLVLFLNCLVIPAWQRRIKRQRWPTKVPLYLSLSKTTSLSLYPPPSLRLTSHSSPPPVRATQSESQVRTLSAGCHKHDADEGPDHTAGRRNSPLTKSGAHDSFITSLTVSRVSTACLWSDNLNIEGVLEFLLSIKTVNGKWFL